MKKQIICVLMAGILALGTGACGSSQKTTPAETPAADTQQEETGPAADAQQEEPNGPAADAQQEEPNGSAADAQPEELNGSAVGTQPEETLSSIPEFVINYYTFNRDIEYSTVAFGSRESIRLTEESAALYPGLQEALSEADTEMAEEASDLFEEIAERAETAWEERDSSEDDFQSGELSMWILPVRNDEYVLSYISSCYTLYTGSVHGFTGSTGYNYDARTGRKIELTDIFNDLTALEEAVGENLRLLADGSLIEDEWGNLPDYFADGGERLTWVIDQDGVTFRFDPYAVASYAAGIVEAHITPSRYPSLFTKEYEEKYAPAKGAYVRLLTPSTYTLIDLDGDGEQELLSVDGIWDQENWYAMTEVKVTVDGKSAAAEDYFYSLGSALLHTEDGRNYIYAEITSDNDYKSMIVFGIEEGVPYEIGRLQGTGFASSYYYDEANPFDSYIIRMPAANPDRFRLGTRMNLMSTYTAYRYYKAGPDGMPVPETQYYEIGQEIKLTSKIPLNAEIVDTLTGEGTGKETELPAGTVCRLWHTNGTDTVDLLLEDGTAVRVYADPEWPQTVNGIELEEAFEGTMFAG